MPKTYFTGLNMTWEMFQHMQLLYGLCEGKVDLPEVLRAEDVPGMGYR